MVSALSLGIFVLSSLNLGLGSNEPLDQHANNVDLLPKRPETAHVDCARLIRGDSSYAKETARHRPKIEPVNLGWNCDAIQARILPVRNPNTGFPILHARIVNEHYDFLEDQLATNYASENVYCFALDKKAPKTFHERFFQLEKCLPNVFVAKIERDTDSAGHDQNDAHLDCMKLVRDKQWEYVILMQNHDVLIKTHGEITQILKIYNGANDVSTELCLEGRCVACFQKNLGKLKLCPKNLNETERLTCEASDIHWGKGAIQNILSRAAIDFHFDEIDVNPFIEQQNKMEYGVDEQLYSSLNINPEIRLPGRFHFKCRDYSQSITRTVLRPYEFNRVWKLWKLIGFIFTGQYPYCPSGKVRHGVCIYGVEDLPFLAKSNAIMANKMMPDFDQAVSSCISELLFNRTRDGSRINTNFYENINAVRYHRERNNPGFNIDEFKC